MVRLRTTCGKFEKPEHFPEGRPIDLYPEPFPASACLCMPVGKPPRLHRTRDEPPRKRRRVTTMEEKNLQEQSMMSAEQRRWKTGGELQRIMSGETRPERLGSDQRHVNRVRSATTDSSRSFRNPNMLSTPHFYDSIETTPDALKPRKTQRHKIKQSKKLPDWCWTIITIVLGVGSSKRWVSYLLYGITLLSALVFTGLGVLFTVYDIASKHSKTTAHIGFISLLIGFAWLCLGIYSFKLAGRLLGDDDFAASVRRHSRTLFKINTAFLLIFLGLGFTGMNLYNAYITFDTDRCNTIGLHYLVCHIMVIGRAVFSVFAMNWNLIVGCVLMSVCRTHTIGIRRFMRDLEQDGQTYEQFWRERLENSKVGEFNKDTVSILNNHDWFLMEEQDGSSQEQLVASGNRDDDAPVSLGNGQTSIQGRGIEQPADDVVLMRDPEDLDDRPTYPKKKLMVQAQSSVETTGSTSDLLDDQPPVMCEDELLLCYWKISSRMRYVSQCMQRWLASWMAFVVIWCADYVIFWLSHSPNILGIMEFIAPMLLLLVLCSAYAEANGDGQSMIRCICPTKERYKLLQFLHRQPLQMQVFNMSISYSAILTVILAFAVAFSSRLILDEVSKA
ncbi:uncharacterized protein LOC128205712 isoform X2 [Mya arenaria]|uniref:uncharacterized protein LOC128205712 isoform X2 n=1 Tax=Mya arenaria TaxID=6604 RepID=UPI0022E6B222|nr:uncharacterized protein LOC128205712 isoform X2 [Mya arenaria]